MDEEDLKTTPFDDPEDSPLNNLEVLEDDLMIDPALENICIGCE